MESLDALPPADYDSLETLSNPIKIAQNDTDLNAYDRNQNIKTHPEHIYAQVIPNCHLNTIQPSTQNSKPEVTAESLLKEQSNKFNNNTIHIKNPTVTLNHTTNVPSVRQKYPNLLHLYQNNYGSLNPTKEENELVIYKKPEHITTDSSVFSISGRRVVVSSGFNGNGTTKKVAVKEPIATPSPLNEWASRSSLNVETDSRLQVCTDCFSLCLFVPGTVLCIISPWLLVPIYIIPSFSGSNLQTLIWISCIGSAILVFMGCLVGNMMWFKREDKWRCRLHCGKGPKNHYWGDKLASKRTVHSV